MAGAQWPPSRASSKSSRTCSKKCACVRCAPCLKIEAGSTRHRPRRAVARAQPRQPAPNPGNTDASQSEALQPSRRWRDTPTCRRRRPGALDYLEELQRGGGAIGDGAAAAARMLRRSASSSTTAHAAAHRVAVEDPAAPAASRSLQYPPPSTTTVPVVSAATLRALPCPAWMRLRAPALSGRDSQAVFEVSVRLQMAEAPSSATRRACGASSRPTSAPPRSSARRSSSRACSRCCARPSRPSSRRSPSTPRHHGDRRRPAATSAPAPPTPPTRRRRRRD